MENGHTNIELFYVLKTQTLELKRWRFQEEVSGESFGGRSQDKVTVKLQLQKNIMGLGLIGH